MNTETQEFKQLVRLVSEKITLKRYFNEYVVKLKPGITQITDGVTSTICPFHDETKPSFSYWHGTDTCYCFGCGVGGGLLQIYRKYVYATQKRNIPMDVAVLELIRLYNLQQDSDIAIQLQKCNATENVVHNKFREYRTKAFAESRIAPEIEVMTLAKYRYLNKRLREDTHMSERVRFHNYAQLDLQAAVALDYVRHK